MYFQESVDLTSLGVGLVILCYLIVEYVDYLKEKSKRPRPTPSTPSVEGPRRNQESRDDRNFEIWILRTHLLNERHIAFFAGMLAAGVAMLIFSASTLFWYPSVSHQVVEWYMVIGVVLFVTSVIPLYYFERIVDRDLRRGRAHFHIEE